MKLKNILLSGGNFMTIKKFTSIILSIVFVFSLFVLPVSAEEVYDDAVELALGEKITINFTDEVWDKYIKFVAAVFAVFITKNIRLVRHLSYLERTSGIR